MVKHITWLTLISLVVAWGFDFLFWNKTPGISFAIFTTLCLAGGFLLAWREGLRPAAKSLLLLVPIAFFALLSFARQESFTQAVNIGLTLALMALLASTFLGGRWFFYSLADYLGKFFELAASLITEPLAQAEKRRKEAAASGIAAPRQPSILRRAIPFLRGLFLALPVVLVFALLLASADPIFSQGVDSFFDLFRIEKLPEYLFRALYIVIIAYALAGVYAHSLTRSRDEHLAGLDKPPIAPALGFIESAMVLGSVDLLFAAFVGVQFRYFFGGQANIHLQGFTFAEYARRGFGELVTVALFSLLLFLGLSTLARRQGGWQRRAFSLLGVALALLVSVMLVSAFQRLTLYEEAYGFTRLRIYTHVFMIWLGALLAALIGLDIFGKLRAFALTALIATLGFAVTLNLLNVDGFIVQQNVSRARFGRPVDSAYLSTLSADATPELARSFTNASLDAALREELGGALACQRVGLELGKPLPWQSYHLSRANAAQIFAGLDDELSPYTLYRDQWGNWRVKVNGEIRDCFAAWRD